MMRMMKKCNSMLKQ